MRTALVQSSSASRLSATCLLHLLQAPHSPPGAKDTVHPRTPGSARCCSPPYRESLFRRRIPSVRRASFPRGRSAQLPRSGRSLRVRRPREQKSPDRNGSLRRRRRPARFWAQIAGPRRYRSPSCWMTPPPPPTRDCPRCRGQRSFLRGAEQIPCQIRREVERSWPATHKLGKRMHLLGQPL